MDNNSKENAPEKTALNKYIKDYAKLKSDYQNAVNRLAIYERDERTLELTQRQNKQLKKRLQQMEESNSWKMTKPIRAFTEKLKKIAKNKAMSNLICISDCLWLYSYIILV